MADSSIKLHRLRISRRVIRLILIAFGLWVILCVLLGMTVYAYGLTDRAQPEDVIIVLGSGLNPDMTPGMALIRRANHAADLWKEHYAPMIICSGGFSTTASRSEASGCAEVLRADGVPSDDILIEDRSRSTEENAFYSHMIMNAHGWKTALIVSDGYHLLRATWIFSAEGINGSTSPAVLPPFVNLVVSVVREVVALHWQVFKTVLNLPVTYVPWW